MTSQSNSGNPVKAAFGFVLLSLLTACFRWFVLGAMIDLIPAKIDAPKHVQYQLGYRIALFLANTDNQLFCYFMIIAQVAVALLLLAGLFVKKSWLYAPAIVYSWLEFTVNTLLFVIITKFGYLVALDLFPESFVLNSSSGKVALFVATAVLISMVAILFFAIWSFMLALGAMIMEVHLEEDKKQCKNLVTGNQSAENHSHNVV